MADGCSPANCQLRNTFSSSSSTHHSPKFFSLQFENNIFPEFYSSGLPSDFDFEKRFGLS